MNLKMKERIKDPKIMTIVALLALLGVENADTASTIVSNIAQSAQKPVEVDPPKIELEGPETVDEGDLIEFIATESYADHFTWTVSPDLDRRFSEDGRKCFFASKPGTYELTLFASNCEGQAVEKRTFTVLDTDDCPDLPDTPITPTPEEPELSGLAKSAYDLATSKVEQKYRGDAGKLAGVYERVAGDSTIKNPQAFADQTVVEIKTALGANTTAWKPWHEAMNATLNQEISRGKLVTISQYREAWKQIAKGLKAL